MNVIGTEPNVWGLTKGAMAAFIAAIARVLVILRGFAHARRFAVAWIVASFFGASAVFAAVPAVQLAPYIKQDGALYFAPMALTLVVSGLMIVSVYGLADRIAWRRFAERACPPALHNWLHLIKMRIIRAG